jgi:hypothetical protein
VYPGGYDARSAGHVSACLELLPPHHAHAHAHNSGAAKDALPPRADFEGVDEDEEEDAAAAAAACVFARYELALCDTSPATAHVIAACGRDAPPRAVRRGRLARARRLVAWTHLDGAPTLRADDTAIFRATVQVVRSWRSEGASGAVAAQNDGHSSGVFSATLPLPPRFFAPSAPQQQPQQRATALPMSCSVTRLAPPHHGGGGGSAFGHRHRRRRTANANTHAAAAAALAAMDEDDDAAAWAYAAAGSPAWHGSGGSGSDSSSSGSGGNASGGDDDDNDGGGGGIGNADGAAALSAALRDVARAAGRRRAAVDALRMALYTRRAPTAQCACARGSIADPSLTFPFARCAHFRPRHNSGTPPPAPPPCALRRLLCALRRSPRDAELAACGCAAVRSLCAAPAWDAVASRRIASSCLASNALGALGAVMTCQPHDSEVQTEACLALGAFALARLNGLGCAAGAAAARGGLSLFASGALERLRAGDADAAAAAAAAAGGGGGDVLAATMRHARSEAAATDAAAAAARAAGDAVRDPAAATAAAHAALDALVAGRAAVAARKRIASELLSGLAAAPSAPPSDA